MCRRRADETQRTSAACDVDAEAPDCQVIAMRRWTATCSKCSGSAVRTRGIGGRSLPPALCHGAATCTLEDPRLFLHCFGRCSHRCGTQRSKKLKISPTIDKASQLLRTALAASGSDRMDSFTCGFPLGGLADLPARAFPPQEARTTKGPAPGILDCVADLAAGLRCYFPGGEPVLVFIAWSCECKVGDKFVGANL